MGRFSLEKYPEVELLDCMIVLLFYFWGKIPYWFPEWLHQFTFPSTVHEDSVFTSSAILVCCLLDNNHSDKCDMTSHSGFDLHFPDEWWCWASSHVDHLYVFFEKCLFRASQVELVVKNLPTSAEDLRDIDLILGLGRSPGGGHDSQLQYSCLENPHRQRNSRLQSIGSQRVWHKWRDLAWMHVHSLIRLCSWSWVVWVLCIFCITSLYNLFSDISLANVFSHSVSCFFVLLIVSFTVQMVF